MRRVGPHRVGLHGVGLRAVAATALAALTCSCSASDGPTEPSVEQSVASACLTGPIDPSGSGLPQAELPAYRDITDATGYDEKLEPMVADPTAARVVALSQAECDAESFAVAFAPLVADASVTYDAGDLLLRTLSSAGPHDLAQALICNNDAQKAIGTDRRYDPSSESWVRSSADGGDEHPSAARTDGLERFRRPDVTGRRDFAGQN